MTAEDFRRAALVGARWTIAGRVALQLIVWPVTIVVMRLLDPGDYGLFALAMLISGFVALFAELGLGVALVQAEEATEAKQRAAATLILGLNLLVVLLLQAAAPLLAAAFDEPALTAVARVLALDLLLSAVAAVPQTMLERQLRFRELSLAQVSAGVAASAATLATALSGGGVWSLVAGLLVQGVVRTLMLLRFHGGVVWPGRVERRLVAPMVHVGGHVIASRGLWYWYSQADLVMLGRILHASLLGYYSVAAQLAMLPASKAMEAVNRVAFPILSRLQSDRVALAEVHRRLIALLALYGFGLCWGLGAVADELVEVLLGEKWAGASWPLACLSFVAPLRAICSLHNTITTAVGQPEAATKELALASAVMPLAVAYGAWTQGLMGAALAWPLAYPVVYLLSNHLTCRAVGVHDWTGIRAMLAPVGAGLVMQVVVWFAGETFDAPGTSTGALLAGEIVLGALTYLAALWLTARRLLLDAFALALELFGRKKEAAGEPAA